MGLAEGGLVTKFQFLMVRLKDITIAYTSYNTSISIPYGAIKRM